MRCTGPVLPAQVVGAAGHVGQRADQLVAALERGLQQPGTHLLHLLHTHTQGTRRWLHCWRCSGRAETRAGEGGSYQQDVVVHRGAGRREVGQHRGTRSLLRFCFLPGVPKHLHVVRQHTWPRGEGETSAPSGGFMLDIIRFKQKKKKKGFLRSNRCIGIPTES